ncbi:hypothetical protein H2O64_15355 [Kordia sp. YSTF-M3]|uniref:Uncharacterized protein n=1 Tax=Kordia aestuariivivens TaxID=2759037 RepID=A0ABR7QBW9_9FLAO|nr:hypothetical protein [Kordia aestuariivivens]MBC8756054.1 hypothetical protein [Kordia aestuariivivens]
MMIQQIRTGKFSKVLSCYLAIQLVLTTIQPTQLFALTGGPSQPEFTAFTPIGTSDMVNINSGSFNYNIPIMDVGGYPLNLAYDAGITMDQEASWVGLGWNLNVGQINRNVRGIPDDFKGDIMTYENSMKKNKTVGMTLSINGQASGTEFGFSGNASATLLHNNYDGFSFTPSFGVSYKFSTGTSVGMNLSPSVENGASLTPTASQSFDGENQKTEKTTVSGISHSIGIGTAFNSRQGLSSFNINTSTSGRVMKNQYGLWKYVGRSSNSGNLGSLSFIDNTFTPAKRTAYHNENYTFRASLGFQVAAFSFEGGASAFYSVQRLKNQVQHEKAYGYEFTRNATHNDVLDFNRENERMVSKNTTTLPIVNYTHDIYHIQGQGIAGQFRPFKSQSGYVYNQRVEDSGDSFSLGAEIEGGWGFRNGIDIHYSPTRSHTGVWDTPGRYRFQSSNTNDIDYEETYFKTIGDLGIDKDQQELYESVLSAEKPMSLVLTPEGKAYGKQAMNVFNVKEYNIDNTIADNSQVTITEPIKRKHREQRNQAILKVNKKEALVDPFINAHTNLKPHHTNGIKIVQPSGATYVYGEAAVNHSKEEVTFAADGIPTLEDGTIAVNGQDHPGNTSGIDNYFNKITTPDYAHTYLLTTVLSNDYEDLTGDGATDDDLGAYTKMHYNNFINDTDISGAKITSVVDDYKWRVPYAANDASYNPGLYTKENDQKGSYVRGEKELKYVTMIETKTHVAIFDFSPREDGLDADGRNASLKVDAIRLYSKPEAKAANLLDDDDSNNQFVAPIKTAHFTYNYSLMPNTPNSDALETGKLTLERVHFTYRNSNMGKYTPYIFNYDNMNPDYQIKSYDVWGNYKPLFEEGVTKVDTDNDGINDDVTLPTGNINTSCEVLSDITAQEFPFVQQNDKELQDLYTAAWTLSSVDLPSGGRIELEYESDDYQYVQDKPAMEMFKVVGVSDIAPESFGDLTTNLYTNAQHTRFLTVELPETEQIPIDDFKNRYLGEYIDNPLFFRFLLNMEKHDVSACSYDYVEGYCNINQSGAFSVFKDPDSGKVYGAIPILLEKKEGGADASTQVILEHPTVQIGADTNPIAKSGWFFARKHLNRYALGTGDDEPNSPNIRDILNAIGSSLGTLAEIFIGPNGYLEERAIARKFKPEKSWIRLKHPSNTKLGGGLRVKKVMMHDNWDVMIENVQANSINEYSNFYGQEYDYTLGENQGSSGVATWEPNMSKENPLLQPFYDDSEKLQAREYVEMPFGKSFYPSATVTYSKVTVKNLDRTNLAENKIVKKHATGKVTSTFYTSKDFPTKSDHTNIDGMNNYKSNQANILDNVLRLSVRTELTLSQGFSIVTNDMNGKSKSQEIHDENGNFISGVDYIYNVTENGELDNKLPVILADGTIDKTKEIGVHYDVITDFNENYNLSESYGVNTNLTFFNAGIIPILLGQLPFEYKRNESILHTTTTTKVVHKTGILVEKVAHDLGASVSTKNLAWDALSGQVLLTETSNAYEDNYYNFSYPAHWAYKGMGQTVTNLGVECRLTSLPENLSSDYDGDENGASTWYEIQGATSTNSSLDELFLPGDQVMVFDDEGESISDDNAYWISQVENIGATSGKKMVLIDRNGAYLNACGEDVNLSDITIKIVKSSYRNFQSAAMASVTSMKNPMSGDIINANDFTYDSNNVETDNPRIINASAVEYEDFWLNPEENIGVQRYPSVAFQNSNQHLIKYPAYHTTNPFLYNIKGDWRAVKSYAYLTTRSSTSTKRNSGFFEKFDPFYTYDATTEKWLRNTDVNNEDDWTYASEVTQYSPYGAELENRDALGRHSAAQYGYNYKLPVAVASNSEYRQMGYEGFEDRESEDVINSHFRISNYATNTNDVFVTEEESHTGRFSLKVEGGRRAFINKKLYNDCLERTQRLDCAPACNNGCDIDEYPDCDCNGMPTCSYEGIGIVSDNEIAIPILLNYGSDGPLPANEGYSLVFNYSSGSISEVSYDSQTGLYLYKWIILNTGEYSITYVITDNNGNDQCSDTITITNGEFAFNNAPNSQSLSINH